MILRLLTLESYLITRYNHLGAGAEQALAPNFSKQPINLIKLKSMKVEAGIPFSGFYESFHDDQLERSLIDEELSDEEAEKLRDEIDWGAERINYSEEYTYLIAKLLKIDLKFVALKSPREYNFGTDRIFARIDEDDIELLKGKVDTDLMYNAVKEQYTSRDGFSSFYSNSYQEWLDQEEPWDHNQIATLIEVYLIQEWGKDWEIEYCIPESF
jgi:hypothetical protein